jgi:DNA-directed RNA polymerase specialized sigma24 family protein
VTTATAGSLTAALGGPLAEFLAERIPRTAAKAHRRCKTIPADDYAQAMWVKMLARPDKYRKYLEEDRGGIVQLTLYRACADLTRQDDRYQRTIKALEDGYSVYDIEFYSTRVLGRLLPALVEAEFDVPAAMDRATTAADAAGIHIRSSDPFGGAENYLVILVDVSAAFGRLPEGMQRLLKTYYAVSQEDTEEGRWARDGLASSMGITGDNLRQRVHRGLERLQDELGGPDPWQ